MQSQKEVLEISKQWQLNDAPDDLILRGVDGEHNGGILAEAIAQRFNNVFSRENLTAAYKATRSRLKLHQPKVVERVVEKVVEKPVEKIVKVIRPEQKMFLEDTRTSGDVNEFADKVRAAEKKDEQGKKDVASQKQIGELISSYLPMTRNGQIDYAKQSAQAEKMRNAVQECAKRGESWQMIAQRLNVTIQNLYEKEEKSRERV
jgi:hypothetical protein